jgi:hypothetical protein
MKRPVINKAKFFVGSRRARRCPFNSPIADTPKQNSFSAMACSFYLRGVERWITSKLK